MFLTEAEAIAKAEKLSSEHNAEELSKIAKKEKPTRTWAWNLSYHRGCIKRAETDLAYHTAKINYARKFVKEEKTAKAI